MAPNDTTAKQGELWMTGPSDPTHLANVAPSDGESLCHVRLQPPEPAVFKLLRLADGTALSNAKVSVRRRDGTVVEGTTDDEGELRVYGPPAEVFTLVGVVDPKTDKNHQLAACDPPVALDAMAPAAAEGTAKAG